MQKQRYEQLPSTSELKLRVFGSDLPDLFENALFAFFDVQNLELGKPVSQRLVQLTGIDHEHLLVELLSEALYLSHKHKEAYLRMRFKVFSGKGLSAELIGSPIVKVSGEEIKAVTHHGVLIHQKNGKFETDLLLDI